MNAKRIDRYYLAIAGLALTLVAAAVVIAVVVLRAGAGSPSLVLLEEQPPEKVVAIVEGQDVTVQDIRDIVYHSAQLFGAWPEQPSMRHRTFAAVDGIIVEAEVKRRGMTPTNREAWEFMKPHRDACLSSPESHCRESIRRLGYEVEEYWTLAFPGYKRQLGRMELTSFVAFDWEASGSAIDEDPAIRINDFYNELEGNASIDWRDETFRIMYEVGLDEHRQRIASKRSPETQALTPSVTSEVQPKIPTVEECQEFFESLAAKTRTGSRPVEVLVKVEGAATERANGMLQICGNVIKEAETAR